MPVMKVRDPSTGQYVPLLGASTTDHGALNGLSDDDHPQYLLVSGSRKPGGDPDMSGAIYTSLLYADILQGDVLQVSGSATFGNVKLQEVAAPTAATDAATKGYVDGQTAALALAGGWADYGGGAAGPNCNKIGGLVQVQALLKPTANYAPGLNVLFQMGLVPVGYRPQGSVSCPITINVGSGPYQTGRLLVRSDGTLHGCLFSTDTIQTASGWVTVNVTYRQGN